MLVRCSNLGSEMFNHTLMLWLVNGGLGINACAITVLNSYNVGMVTENYSVYVHIPGLIRSAILKSFSRQASMNRFL